MASHLVTMGNGRHMDGTEGKFSDDTWVDSAQRAEGLDLGMEKHEAYIRRKAQREEAKRHARRESKQEVALPEAPAEPDVVIADAVSEVEDIQAAPETEPQTEQPSKDEIPDEPLVEMAVPARVGPQTDKAQDNDASARGAMRKALRRQKMAMQSVVETVTEEPSADASASQLQAAPEAEIDVPEAISDTPQVAPNLWSSLEQVKLDAAHLARSRIVTAGRDNPAHVAFDVLRTRLLAALREKGWKRVAITSPTKNCGKTFVAANLAISLARQVDCKTVLMDLDLRNPSLSKILGITPKGKIADFLTGERKANEHFQVAAPNALDLGNNLAFALNTQVETYAAERLTGAETQKVLSNMERDLEPDVILFDLPPALHHDDVMAFRPHFDGVLLVVGGGVTTAKEIREVKRRLGEETPLLGVVMNKAEGVSITSY